MVSLTAAISQTFHFLIASFVIEGNIIILDAVLGKPMALLQRYMI